MNQISKILPIVVSLFFVSCGENRESNIEKVSALENQQQFSSAETNSTIVNVSTSVPISAGTHDTQPAALQNPTETVTSRAEPLVTADIVNEVPYEDDEYSFAIDNATHKVVANFQGYNVVVYANRVISSEPSQSSKAIYGKIDGQSTTSLLSISGNYIDGDSFKVKVYKDNQLVGESKSAVLHGEFVEFSDITIGEGK